LALINHRTHEIHFKIVYYGPGLCGKTTNLKSLHDKLPPERRGKMISIATDQERTLFFDFLPIDLGTVNGFLTRFHLYTVPGQVYYRLSRRAVLQGVDGLVFVADSHPAREAANRESLADLNDHLRTLGITGPALARIPWVFQWNKRDHPVTIPIERLQRALNPQGWPEYEAIASEGKGVSETLRAACKAVLARLGAGAAATPAHPAAAVGAAAPPAAAAAARPAAVAGPTTPGAIPGAVASPRPTAARTVTPATVRPAATQAVPGSAARPVPPPSAPDAGWSPHRTPPAAPAGSPARIVSMPGAPPSIVVPGARPAPSRAAEHGVATAVRPATTPTTPAPSAPAPNPAKSPDEPARP
jgi:hypothetical protein